jgi:cupin 2 domain-containing protein
LDTNWRSTNDRDVIAGAYAAQGEFDSPRNTRGDNTVRNESNGERFTNPTNLLAHIPSRNPDELFQTLVRTPAVRVERIVSWGHSSREDFWYDQDAPEWVLVLKGTARLTLEGEPPLDLEPGDFVSLPAHRRHRVDWTAPDQPTVWLAIYDVSGTNTAG